MTQNVVAIGPRNVGGSALITAGGGYTLPQYAYVPTPGSQPITGSMIPSPGPMGNPGFFGAAHVDSSLLPGATYRPTVGIKVQAAQIQANTDPSLYG